MKRRIRQNIYGNWKGYVGRNMVEDFGTDELDAHERLMKHKENPMKNFRPPYHVDFHSERGEVSIHVTDADDNEVWYADTDMVNELVEDGFLDTRGFIMGRNARPDVLEKSVIDYLRSVGIIPDLSEKPSRHAPLPTTVYDDARDLYDENPSRAMGHFRKGFGELRGDFDAALEAVRRRNREENPCGHRRNPGDVHIDIQSHNTRGSHVRAKNPVRKLWVIQWFNEDHPVEPMWMERTSFEGTHDEAMETLNILQKNQPHIEFRLAEDRLRSRRENPTRNVRAKNPRPSYQVIVSNMGVLCDTYDRNEAMSYYKEAVAEVSSPRGRASGETVTLIFGDEIVKEYQNEFQSHRQGTRKENPTRDSITFQTDRQYAPNEYQTVVAWIVGREEGAQGFDFLRVRFWDFQRQVGGEIFPLFDLTQSEVMRAYDAGQYHSVYITPEEIDRASGGSGGKRRPNPTREDVDGWIDRYRTSMEKRIDGVPEKVHYVVKIVTKDGQGAWLRVGKGTKFDTDPAKARVYRNGDKANEAATKVANWLKKKQPAKWKKIATISAEPKK